MLHELKAFRQMCDTQLQVADVTVILAIRLHQGNPWVLDRLLALREHYEPMPQVLVVDFGSEPPYGASVSKACLESGFQYVYVADHGTFSLAKARNVGSAHASTKLLFFSDADCFGERELFRRLVDHANVLEMGSYLEQIVNLPVYHLSDDVSEQVWKAPNASERSLRIARAMNRQVFAAVEPFTYVDPSSNFFLIRRDFFDLTGGYNENFRGHGSEDFEYLLRLGHFTNQFPLPAHPEKDVYAPIRDSFFKHKDYRGIRRYCELIAFQAEAAGLRISHIAHPRSENDAWYKEKDYRKVRFREQVKTFLETPAKLLDFDWMPREKRCLVLLKHERQYSHFIPLRLLGYRLQLMLAGDASTHDPAMQGIEQGEFQAVAVFNPYMSSHREELKPYLDAARAKGIKVLVVDRGMLPESWFYAEDMPYADSEFLSLDLSSVELSPEELDVAREYISAIRKGGSTLEHNGDFEATLRRRKNEGRGRKLVVVPLQLDEDIAVTRFNEGYQSYKDFVAEIGAVARAHPQLHFLVKPHPLSKRPFVSGSGNVTVCDQADNIHALLELAELVICYNSGVGMLALLHEKRLVTIGNAFYNLPEFGRRAATFADAVRLSTVPAKAGSREQLERYTAWLLFRKYAFFKGRSVIQEHDTRRAHHYQDLVCYRLPGRTSLSCLRVADEHSFQLTSYASGKLAIAAGVQSAAEREAGNGADQHVRSAGSGLRLPAPLRKFRKLVRNPRLFLADSKLNPLGKGNRS